MIKYIIILILALSANAWSLFDWDDDEIREYINKNGVCVGGIFVVESGKSCKANGKFIIDKKMLDKIIDKDDKKREKNKLKEDFNFEVLKKEKLKKTINKKKKIK